MTSEVPSETPKAGLKKRAVGATMWSLLLKVLTRLLGVVTTVSLARLLSPADYGIFAVIAIADGLLNVLTETSLATALVQVKGDTEDMLDTAFTAQLVRGVVVFALMWLVAPFWCGSFGVPEATSALRALTVAQLVQGATSIRVVLLIRDMRFDKLFFLYLGQALANAVTVITAAIVLRNVWAFVLAPIAENVARVIISYAIAPYRPRLSFDRAKAREMFRYTRWLMGYSVVDLALETGGHGVVGKLLGKADLGLYRMGYQLASEGARAMSTIVSRVAFPLFANVQSDPARIRRGFQAVFGSAVLVLLPLTASFFTFGDLAIPVILGPQWAQAVMPTAVLGIACCARGILETTTTLFRGLGHTKTEFQIKVVQLVLLVASIALLAGRYGAIGVASAVALSAVGTLPVWLYLVVKVAGVGLRDALAPTLVPVIATALAVVATLALRAQPALAGLGRWPALGVVCLVYGGVYAGACALVQRSTRWPGFLSEVPLLNPQ